MSLLIALQLSGTFTYKALCCLIQHRHRLRWHATSRLVSALVTAHGLLFGQRSSSRKCSSDVKLLRFYGVGCLYATVLPKCTRVGIAAGTVMLTAHIARCWLLSVLDGRLPSNSGPRI